MACDWREQLRWPSGLVGVVSTAIVMAEGAHPASRPTELTRRGSPGWYHREVVNLQRFRPAGRRLRRTDAAGRLGGFCAAPDELVVAVNGIAIDNEIVAPPQVECTQNGIRLRVPTRNPFLGRIFVKGESDTPECSTGTAGPQNYRDASGDSTFSLSFDRCGMYRLRMLNPRGMMYTTTIVVSFHPM
uniref:ZP domain-containing protein n=1 Tax=Plectus sambesii TaxID=2011161 RepID=A0A914W6A5_9BILA